MNKENLVTSLEGPFSKIVADQICHQMALGSSKQVYFRCSEIERCLAEKLIDNKKLLNFDLLTDSSWHFSFKNTNKRINQLVSDTLPTIISLPLKNDSKKKFLEIEDKEMQMILDFIFEAIHQTQNETNFREQIIVLDEVMANQCNDFLKSKFQGIKLGQLQDIVYLLKVYEVKEAIRTSREKYDVSTREYLARNILSRAAKALDQRDDICALR